MAGYRKAAAVSLAALLLVGTAACGGNDDGASTSSTTTKPEGKVEIDSDGNGVKYTDEEGNATKFGDELPEGWPANLAPPDSVTISSSSTKPKDGAQQMYVLGTATATAEELLAGLTSQVQSAGYEVTSSNSTSQGGQDYAALSAESDDYTLTATISSGPEDGSVGISMILTEVTG